MLCGMALKWRWRDRMKAAGKPTDRPNLVMGANVQVCWEKFCRYWEVEPRLVPMEGETFHLTADRALAHCDENTIGVVAILGSTFDGSYEPVKEIADALDQLESDAGHPHPAARRRRLGRVRGPVPGPRPGVGLPPPARAVDQRLGPQVRPRLPRRRLGDLARQEGAAPRPGLRRQLPRRQHADVRAELLAARQRGRGPVLHVHEPRPRGLHGDDADPAGDRDAHLQSGRRDRSLPADLRRQRAAGVRVRAQPRGQELHRVRRVRPPARGRLAGAGLHLPGEPPGPERAADRRPRRHARGDGRPAARRPAPSKTKKLESLGGAAPPAWRAPPRRSRTDAQRAARSQHARPATLPAASSCVERRGLDHGVEVEHARPNVSSSRVPTIA